MITVLHVITDLDVGGAELMLHRLVRHGNPRRLQHSIVCLRGGGPVRELLVRDGANVVCLEMEHWRDVPRVFRALQGAVRDEKPDVIHTWLVHANLIGGAVARRSNIPVIWSLRHGVLRRGDSTPLTRALLLGGNALSWWMPDQVVSCSRHAADEHARFGFDRRKIVVIHNGYEVSTGPATANGRARLRNALGLSAEAVVIGMVARFDPMKDHACFLNAAKIVSRSIPTACFVLIGPGMTSENEALNRLVDDADIGEKLHRLGHKHDVADWLTGFDVATLTSRSEGFPNVLAEAMACGIPCVATDVGETRTLLGDAGLVVPPADPGRLASAWERLLALPAEARRELGERGRARVGERFGIRACVEAHEGLYQEVVQRAASKRGDRWAA